VGVFSKGGNVLERLWYAYCQLQSNQAVAVNGKTKSTRNIFTTRVSFGTTVILSQYVSAISTVNQVLYAFPGMGLYVVCVCVSVYMCVRVCVFMCTVEHPWAAHLTI